MGKLVTYEAFLEFRRAADCARGLAKRHGVRTGVQRIGSGWCVLVPPVLARERKLPDWQGEAHGGNLHAEDDAAMESDLNDEREMLTEELASDQEDWARSEEEGWFYGDDE